MPSELATTLAASEEDRLLQAEALVRAHCGWHVAPVRLDTMSLGLSSDATVVLPTQRIVEVVSVSDGLVGLDPDAYTWREPGILDLRPTFSVRAWGDLYDARSYTWFQNLTVRLRHGYDEAPPEVTAVVQAVAQRVVNNPKGLVRETIGPFVDSYAVGLSGAAAGLTLLGDEQRALAPYRLPKRA
jgi:hypothetical protein